MLRARIALAAVVAVAAALALPAAAPAANGDNLSQITAAGSCGINVGLAFDGTDLYISCYDDNRIDVVAPSDGHLIRTFSVTGVSSLGALAYDRGRNILWGCSATHDVVQIDPQSGASTAAFSTNGCFDGLAYDGSDDTLWVSPDASTPIQHFTATGTLIQAFPVNLGGSGNSGIAVGGDTLYLANDGGSQIWTTDKTVSSPTLFATFPRRLEDMECDERTFAPKAAIWSQDAYDRILNAYEIPAGSCGTGGAPPDTVGPTVTATQSPQPNADGWINSAATVTVNAVDPDISGSGASSLARSASPTFPGSGVKEIDYTMAGASTGGGTIPGDTGQVKVPAEGVTTLTFHAVDNIGNTGPDVPVTVSLDTTAPAIAITNPADDNALLGQGDQASGLFTCDDALSGIASCTASSAASARAARAHARAASSGSAALDTAAPGAHVLAVSATDKAGNTATASRTYTVSPAIVQGSGTTTAPKACASRRRFVVHMKQLRGVRFVSVRVKLDKGKVFGVRRDNGGIFVDLRGLPKGTFKVTITARDQHGRRYTNTRTYRTCTPRAAR